MTVARSLAEFLTQVSYADLPLQTDRKSVV